MKRTCISTSLLLPVAALYFCVAPASSAATLEAEPGSSLYYSDEGTGTPILFDKLIQHLEMDKVVLVGWSYGCLACYAYVRHHGLDKISCFVGIDQSPHPLDLDDGPKWNEGPLTETRDSFNGVNYNRAEFTAAFAQWMVKRKYNRMDHGT